MYSKEEDAFLFLEESLIRECYQSMLQLCYVGCWNDDDSRLLDLSDGKAKLVFVSDIRERTYT